MLADRALIEAVGLARQFELAVKWLVRDAEQGAVGYAEAIALRGDRRRFHVDAHRAAEREAQRRAGVAQLPVAIVRGHDRAGAQAALELLARLAGNRLGGARKRLLDF